MAVLSLSVLTQIPPEFKTIRAIGRKALFSSLPKVLLSSTANPHTHPIIITVQLMLFPCLRHHRYRPGRPCSRIDRGFFGNLYSLVPRKACSESLGFGPEELFLLRCVHTVEANIDLFGALQNARVSRP